MSGMSCDITPVELRGLEPLTFSLRTRRATNCAIAPRTGWADQHRDFTTVRQRRTLAFPHRRLGLARAMPMTEHRR